MANYRGEHHNGVDIGKAFGAEIVSASDGVVVNAGNQDRYCPRGAYGKYVVIKHNNGLTTLYGHLASYIIEEGEPVKRGDVIGYMGKTGWATGPHLHFTVYGTNTYRLTQSVSCGLMPVGGDIDPQKYL